MAQSQQPKGPSRLWRSLLSAVGPRRGPRVFFLPVCRQFPAAPGVLRLVRGLSAAPSARSSIHGLLSGTGQVNPPLHATAEKIVIDPYLRSLGLARTDSPAASITSAFEESLITGGPDPPRERSSATAGKNALPPPP